MLKFIVLAGLVHSIWIIDYNFSTQVYEIVFEIKEDQKISEPCSSTWRVFPHEEFFHMKIFRVEFVLSVYRLDKVPPFSTSFEIQHTFSILN